MSLRIFHIIFISVSVALCIFVALWGVRQSTSSGAVLAAVFFLSAVALLVYGKKVFRKLKELP
jgi:hypothetical protein